MKFLKILEDYPTDDVEKTKEALNIAKQLNLDFNKIKKDQFIKGYFVEWEHGHTVNNDKIIIAKIVLDHLKEDADYYTKLLNLRL